MMDTGREKDTEPEDGTIQDRRRLALRMPGISTQSLGLTEEEVNRP